MRNQPDLLVSRSLAALLMSTAPYTSTLAADAFTDKNGLRWEPTGPVEYSDGRMTEPIEGPNEYGAESGLIEMSVSDVKDRFRPIMEIGGIQYTLSEEQAEEFAKWVFQKIGESESAGKGPQQRTHRNSDPVGDNRSEAVFGIDDRYSINHQAHRQPYARIAKTWSADSVCTAFKAYNHHTALTAAHCVHDGPNRGWRTRHEIQFAAGSGQSGGTGQAKNPLPPDCYGRVVPGGWASTAERQYDFAVLYLHGRDGAWCNLADYDVGYYGYTVVSGSGISGYVSGYPDAATSPNGGWGDLWYAAGSDAYQAGDTIRHTVDTSAGESGSPFATRTDDVNSQFMGVHVAATPDYNIASRAQTAMINFIITYAGY